MALSVGENSYVSLEDANAYFEDRLDVDAWTSATDTLKEQALVTSTRMLDELTWSGVAVSETQPLAFPRSGSYFDPRLGMTVQLSADVATKRISIACYELAYHLLNNDGLTDEAGMVQEIRVGAIHLSKVRAPAKIPGTVNRVIQPMLANKGANVWWRAN